MLELILISIALIGSFVCGAIDLKTTEIPDEIPTAMALLGMILWSIVSLQSGDVMPVVMSALVGTSYLALGWLLYLTKQWGGGDAKLLAAIGYLIPVWLTESTGLLSFALAYLFNVFVIGLFYMIFYIVVLGLMRRNVRRIFAKDIREYGWKILLIVAAFTVIAHFFIPIWFVALIDFFAVAILYAKSVEKYFFKTIPVSQLRVGDVLAEGKIDGLTKEQVAELKKKGGRVRVKDGVRYGFVFFLTLVVTLFYGSLVELAVEQMVLNVV